MLYPYKHLVLPCMHAWIEGESDRIMAYYREFGKCYTLRVQQNHGVTVILSNSPWFQTCTMLFLNMCRNQCNLCECMDILLVVTKECARKNLRQNQMIKTNLVTGAARPKLRQAFLLSARSSSAARKQDTAAMWLLGSLPLSRIIPW